MKGRLRTREAGRRNAEPHWKARILGVLVLLLALTGVPAPGLAQVDGCPEPNDDPAAACPLSGGSAVQSFVERPGDIDVYRIEAPGGGQLQLELTDLPADYDLYLADAQGGVLGQSAHEGTAPEGLQLTVQPGTYYAVVQADPSREVDASRPYTLRLGVAVRDPAAPNGAAVPPVRGRILLSDSFDDPKQGILPPTSSSPATLEVGYVQGEYSVRKLDATEVGRGALVPGTFDDATLAMDSRIIGEVQERRIRLTCRFRPSNEPGKPSSYSVRIFPASREYEILRTDLGQDVVLIPRQFSSVIRRDNEWNHLEFSCIGSTLSVHINGQDLGSIDDNTYQRGALFLIVSGPASGTPPAEARFDNLVVYGP